MSKRWQRVEIDYLKKHASSKSLEELAERFHVDIPTVERKLRELKLDAAASGTAAAAEKEALGAFEKGMSALYDSKWSAAAGHFETVIGNTAQAELAARARQLFRTAKSRSEEPETDDDPYLEAVFEKNRGDLAAALKICEAKKRLQKDGRFAYLAASIKAIQEQPDEAEKLLEKAIELDPRNRIHARHDPDFEAFRSDEARRAILA